MNGIVAVGRALPDSGSERRAKPDLPAIGAAIICGWTDLTAVAAGMSRRATEGRALPIGSKSAFLGRATA